MVMELTRSTFAASEYQQAIFDRVEKFDTDIVVSAVAGSGKSTTLKQLLDYIPSHMSVLFLAFNSDAAKSLGDKLTSYAKEKHSHNDNACNFASSTIHSLGNATLRGAGISGKPKTNKYSQLCKEHLTDNLEMGFKISLVNQFAKLVDMVRLTLSDTDETSLLALMDRFEIDIPTLECRDDEDCDELVETPEWTVIKHGVSVILKQGIKLAKSAKEYDFTDMIWLPSSKAMNLIPKQYDWVLVDEAQDLSPAQRQLVLRARKAGGHFIAVGDKKQAIYGFAGASLQSIDEIIEATNAVEMPLSICYRCPSKVIDLANTIWPGTEARPDAPEGIVERLEKSQMNALVQSGDLILCRLTAPLVEKCLELLRSGIRANVRGKDIGSQFTNLIDQIKKHFVRFSEQRVFLDLVNNAREYQRHQTAILSKNPDNEMRIDSLKDKVDTLIALLEAYLDKVEREDEDEADFNGFQAYIKEFFTDDPNAQIILSTGHRAKGLEYKRVFILQSDKLPHPKAKTFEAITQEHNLMYVMYTRAMEALYLVQETPVMPVIAEQPVIAAPIVEAVAVVEVPAIEQDTVAETPVALPISLPKKHKGGKSKDGSANKKGEQVSVGYRFPKELVDKLALLAKLAEETSGEKFDKGSWIASLIEEKIDETIALLQKEN